MTIIIAIIAIVFGLIAYWVGQVVEEFMNEEERLIGEEKPKTMDIGSKSWADIYDRK